MQRRSYTMTACLLSAFLLLGFMGTGCGDDGTTNDCEGVANACVTENANRCNATNSGVQTCQTDANGCLVWTDSMTCGDRQECQTSGTDAACRCNSECTTANETQCSTTNTTVIQTCTADTHGCLFWQDGTDCATTSQFCDDTNEPAVCSDTCTDQCTQGETQCNGTIIQGCVMVGACLDWVNSTDCADSSQVCVDINEPAICVDSCTDSCGPDGATQCDGEVVQTCSTGVDGCLAWSNTTDCSANSEFCVESGGAASCQSTCQDRCTPDGAMQCGGADSQTVQTCGTAASGCLDWSDGDTCVPPRFDCELNAGVASCVEQCTDECATVNATQCNGADIETCTLQADGCNDWVVTQTCADPTPVCEDSTGTATCTDACSDECDTINEVQCNSDNTAVEACQEGGDGCNDWVVTSDCAANSQICTTYSGAPRCEDPCTNECTENETQCASDTEAVETCNMQANGCTEWEVTATCAGATPMCDDSSEPALCVCVDECDTISGTQCDGADIQICTQGGDGCNDWVYDSTCQDPTPACDDTSGSATCVCEDTCDPATDLDRCAANGVDIEACTQGGDGCYDYAVSTTCADPTPVCDDSAGAAACVCADECSPEDATQCDMNNEWIQTCVPDGDADACLEWDDTTDCTQGGSSNDVCEDATGTAECVSTCTDECDTLGATQCNAAADAIEECQVGADTCNDWVEITPCSGDTPLCDTPGGTATCVCIDECSPVGGVCNANVPENCVDGGDGCTDLQIGQDCSPDSCVIDGTGMAICEGLCSELVNQPISPIAGGFANQDFVDAGNDAFDIFLADDFTVNGTWDINTIYVPGTLWNGGTTLAAAESLNIAIWGEGGGYPDGVPNVGAPVALVTLPIDDPQVTLLEDVSVGIVGSAFIELTTPITLSAGTYWFTYWPRLPFAGGGQFGWFSGNTLNGFTAQVVNPGGGFGDPIPTTWGSIQPVWGAEYYDMAFTLWSGSGCCLNQCPAIGETRCSADGLSIEACDIGSDPSCGESGYEWGAGVPCQDPTPFCDASSGVPTCVGGTACTGTDLGSAVGAAVATGNSAASTDDFAGSCGNADGLDECFTWSAPNDATYAIDTFGSDYDTVLYAIEGVNEIACNDQSGGNQSEIIVNLTAGTDLVIVIDGWAPATGNYILNITEYPPEVDCADWLDNDIDGLFDCADPTECQGVSGSCTPGAGAVGIACSAHTDCAATMDDPACLSEADLGFGGGYCSEWCTAGTDDCPSGSDCLYYGGLSTGLCFDHCATVADCRADTWVDPDSGYDCVYSCDDPAGTGQNICFPQCAPACTAQDLGTFSGSFTLTGEDNCAGTSAYNAGASATDCTGWASNGNELLYMLTIPAGVSVQIDQTTLNHDASLWVITDCGDINGEGCIAGSDNTVTGGAPESVVVDNTTGSDLVVYIVADGYSGCGVYDLIFTAL